jgi:hypothetical protein
MVLSIALISIKFNFALPIGLVHIVNDGESDKQACENKAALFWIKNELSKIISILSPCEITILADDLYSHQPIIDALIEAGVKFILNCKETSHRALSEFTTNPALTNEYEKIGSDKNFNGDVGYTYKWLNGVPIKDDKNPTKVNWGSLTLQGEYKKSKENKEQSKEINHKVKSKNATKLNPDVEENKINNKIRSMTFSYVTNLELNQTNIE